MEWEHPLNVSFLSVKDYGSKLKQVYSEVTLVFLLGLFPRLPHSHTKNRIYSFIIIVILHLSSWLKVAYSIN